MASSSDIESNRSDLSGSGELARAVLYNNPKDVATALGRSGVGFVPTASIIAYASYTLPEGFLWANGALVQKSTYPNLYKAFGPDLYAYDTAAGFYLPNLCSSIPAGRDRMGGVTATGRMDNSIGSYNAQTLGAIAGSQYSQDHNHTFTSGGQSLNHYHAIGLAFGPRSYAWTISAGGAGYTTAGVSYTGYAESDHNHPGTTNSPSGTTGNGTQQNIPPIIVLNFIIKT